MAVNQVLPAERVVPDSQVRPWMGRMQHGAKDGNAAKSLDQHCRKKSRPHFSPEGKMIAQGFVSTRDFLTERNTDCLSEGRKFLVGTKIKRGIVILVRNAG